MNGLTLLALIVVAIGVVVAYRLGLRQGERARAGGSSPAAAPEQDERSRLPSTKEPEVEALRVRLAHCDEERHEINAALAGARAEAARYRQIVIDLEDNAPPPLLDGQGSPDDLKLIVGVGPVLERMLHQLGIASYRAIARWTERDIDAFDAKLAEFPGRIRRDGWVAQARSLHQSKYGETLPARDAP